MQRINTRKRILEATMKLISEKGYLGASTREIAHEAGVTELTLFRHFGTKEMLFGELIKECSVLTKLKDLLPELKGLSCEATLKKVGVLLFETFKERKSFIRIMLSEINLYPEKVIALHNRLIEDLTNTLADYFRSLQKKGLLRKISPVLAASAFLGMVFSYFRVEEIIRAHNVTKREMEKTMGGFVDIFVHGIIKDSNSIQ